MAWPVLRSALRPARLAAPMVRIAAFSSSAPSSSGRQVLIQLLEDVDGLGYSTDRVLVNPGRARNQLIPTGKARFVPWKRSSDRVEHRAERASEPSLSASSSTPIPAAPTAPEILSAIAALPPTIEFPHRTISPTAKTIYGSVTLADVSKRLEDDYKIPSAAVDVFWRNEDDLSRMKELGRWGVEVAPKGGEDSVVLTIEVTRIEEE